MNHSATFLSKWRRLSVGESPKSFGSQSSLPATEPAMLAKVWKSKFESQSKLRVSIYVQVLIAATIDCTEIDYF